MMKPNSYLLLVVSLILLAGCAQQGMPSGGEKDTIPPQITKSEPLNESTAYQGNSVIITFDEFIKPNNLGQELIVSPPLRKTPEFKIRKKSLIISFQDTLKENTTYTFNLGQGIVDFHEGNPLDSNIFVFSTGTFLDSGLVRGVVKDAFTLAPPEKALVMLYEKSGDSLPSEQRPYYYTKIQEDGSFHLTHLKEGSYQLFALIDQNNNYLYDLPNESIAFSTELISTEIARDSNFTLHLFQEDLQKLFVQTAKAEQYGKIQVLFNKAADNPQVRVLNRNESPDFTEELNTGKDTLTLWYVPYKFLKDTIDLEISAGGIALDTIAIKLPKQPKKGDEREALNPVLTLNTPRNIARYFEPLYLYSSHPITQVTNNQAVLIEGKDTLAVKLIQQDNHTFLVDHTLLEETRYQFFLRDSSLIGLLGQSHDTTKLSFQTKNAIQYANLDLNITGLEGQYTLVQLRDEKDERQFRQDTLNGNESLRYRNLEPGKYKLKMIFDDNRNGQWDPGDYFPRKQPERVIYFSGEIEIKEGWDKKLDWIIPR